MKRFAGVLLLLTLITCLGLPAAAQGINARNLLKLARSAAEAKDWEKAKDYANKALQEEGGYLDAYYMRAYAHRELGQKKKAEEDFREVIRRDPGFLPTYGALADMYLADKEWDKAEKVFNDLGQQNDGSKWASYYRGVMAYMRADLKKAEAQWKDALVKDVNFAQAIHNLGAVSMARKEYPRALSLFREALDKKPQNAMYRFHVAWAQEKLGQTPKALEGLKAIMNENADSQQFWLLARALDQMIRGQNETALKVLETVTKDNPSSLDGWFLKGRAALAVGKNDLAREALTKAKEVDPSFQETDALLAKLPPVAAPQSPPVEQPKTPTTESQVEAPNKPPTETPAEQPNKPTGEAPAEPSSPPVETPSVSPDSPPPVRERAPTP